MASGELVSGSIAKGWVITGWKNVKILKPSLIVIIILSNLMHSTRKKLAGISEVVNIVQQFYIFYAHTNRVTNEQGWPYSEYPWGDRHQLRKTRH